jgi:hypothetical protein
MATPRKPTFPTTDAIDAFCAQFDALFNRRAARQAFRHYLIGLLLPWEHNKTMTVLASLVPGSDRQQLHHFLHDAPWNAAALTQQRLVLWQAQRPWCMPWQRRAGMCLTGGSFRTRYWRRRRSRHKERPTGTCSSWDPHSRDGSITRARCRAPSQSRSSSPIPGKRPLLRAVLGRKRWPMRSRGLSTSTSVAGRLNPPHDSAATVGDEE